MTDPMLIATLVRDCLCSFLEGSLGGPVCRCSVYPSVIHTADICDRHGEENGEAKISITNMYDSKSFPSPIDVGECPEAYLVLEVQQTVWRCGPSLSGEGELPSVEEEELAAAILLDDARAMRCTISCCLGIKKLFQIGTWQMLPASGGCVGGRLTSLVGVDVEPCFDMGSL